MCIAPLNTLKSGNKKGANLPTRVHGEAWEETPPLSIVWPHQAVQTIIESEQATQKPPVNNQPISVKRNSFSGFFFSNANNSQCWLIICYARANTRNSGTKIGKCKEKQTAETSVSTDFSIKNHSLLNLWFSAPSVNKIIRLIVRLYCKHHFAFRKMSVGHLYR